MRHLLLAWVIWLIACLTARPETVPVPEGEQAAKALGILNAYHGMRPVNPPEKLYVIYFTPSDREPTPDYTQRLEPILEDIQAFYRNGMKRLGFGPKTFHLERDAQGRLTIHLVRGKDPESDYNKPDGGRIAGECRPVLEAAGISTERETTLIFCNLATWDDKARTFSHHSPYYGMWTQTNGVCFAVDSVIQNLDDLPKKEPILDDDEYGKMSLGKFNTIFIGGIAHELGHAFALPHCGERWDEKALGTSIMGMGNHTYREERRGEGNGSFLTMGSAMQLAGRPLFNGSDKGMDLEGRLQRCDLTLSTNLTRADLASRHGRLRVEGTVVGSPPVYGVVAYFDSLRDGGYHAPSATSVPDDQGQFAIEVSDLAPCGSGELRVEFCHANGAVSERRLFFSVTADGYVDLTQSQIRQALEPIANAVADNDHGAAQSALQVIENSEAPALVKVIGRKLASTLDAEQRLSPAEVPTQVTRLALGDAQPKQAEVGWLKPAANRLPANNEEISPLLDSGTLYATGLYAHAPSRYTFNLDGKWGELSGEAGLQTQQQRYGSVVFVIKTDGREVFRSPVIRGDQKAVYRINVADVKQLELVVDIAGDNNHNDWGLWLDPTLTR